MLTEMKTYTHAGQMKVVYRHDRVHRLPVWDLREPCGFDPLDFWSTNQK